MFCLPSCPSCAAGSQHAVFLGPANQKWETSPHGSPLKGFQSSLHSCSPTYSVCYSKAIDCSLRTRATFPASKPQAQKRQIRQIFSYLHQPRTKAFYLINLIQKSFRYPCSKPCQPSYSDSCRWNCLPRAKAPPTRAHSVFTSQ
jgi:hypothetical protein